MGTQPFVASAFYPDIAAILLIAALIVRAERERVNNPDEDVDPAGVDSPGSAIDRLLLAGALLYALALLGSYAIPSAVGGNVDRLGALLAGPVARLRADGAPPRACCSCSRRSSSTGRSTRRSRTSPRPPRTPP